MQEGNGKRIGAIVLLMCLQLVLAKYCQAGLMYICILPAIVLCMPTSRQSWINMAATFLLAMIVDVAADGVPGLEAIPLVVCAAIQKPVISFFIDDSIVTRGYSFSYRRNGWPKIFMALLCEVAVFFIIYVIFDSAGERSFGFNLSKILISSGVSLIFSLAVCNILCPDKR